MRGDVDTKHRRPTSTDCGFVVTIEMLPSFEDRGQTDRVTMRHTTDSAAAAGLGRATSHDSSR